MQKRACLLILCLLLWGVDTGPARAAAIGLHEYGFNIDGAVYEAGSPLPGFINTANFDFNTGLGTVSINLGGAGKHSVLAFFDHEIDESTNTFFNEIGTATGSPGSGQSWEIDEPGWVFGDIFTHFSANRLDNRIGTLNPEDVSMAIGWDLFLASGDSALITIILSKTMPAAGFFLTHSDPDSGARFFFSSALSSATNPIPEPATLVLLGAGLAFGARWIRRMK